MVSPMTSVAVTLSGTTPLLCCRPSSEIECASDPRAQAASRLYRDAMGHPVLPSPNVIGCLLRAVDAGGHASANGRRSLSIRQAEIAIQSSQPWSVDSRQVRRPGTSTRELCHRPRFDAWRLAFSLIVDPAWLPVETIRGMVEHAGRHIGLGDFRPERGGPFGRFTISSWETP